MNRSGCVGQTSSVGLLALGWTAILASLSDVSALDWPTVRGNAQRTGYTTDTVPGPWRLEWVTEFPEETICTRVEAIVANGRVFVGTLQGGLWAVDRNTGQRLWRQGGFGPIMHSPAWHEGRVLVADAHGSLVALDAHSGNRLWEFRSGRGGWVSAPLVWQGVVYAGSRDGFFYAVDAATGQLRWRSLTGGPIRLTAAANERMIVVASDDMHAYAFAPDDGQLLWKSAKLPGQSFRDYYPVLVGDKVLLRSVLVEEVNDDLNGGTVFLQRRAGIPGGWRELEQFWQSGRWRVDKDVLLAEQRAILDRLEDNPYRRTFFVLDERDGVERLRAPVLYAAGNQGCGIPPAVTGRGEVIVFYRTVYSNWNRGVKPAVGLGTLDLSMGWIEPLWHTEGNQPPWNTFWGTSDESTNLSIGGRRLYLCHQRTLACFDLETHRLEKVFGERDTWGGFLAPRWVANEWHGPARGSCAISDRQLFWVTGSRLLCLSGGTSPSSTGETLPGPAIVPSAGEAELTDFDVICPEVPSDFVRNLVTAALQRQLPQPMQRDWIDEELERRVQELLDGHPWAPFYLQMGIGSRDFYFAHPSYLLEALAWAIPYLPDSLSEPARRLARSQLEGALRREGLALNEGRRRELFDVPPHALSWSYYPTWPSVSHLYAVWLYGERTGDWEAVRELWPRIAPWVMHLPDVPWDERQQAHLYMNRTAAGLLALARLAHRFGTAEQERRAQELLRQTLNRIVQVWYRKAKLAEIILSQSYHRGDITGNPVRHFYYHLNNHKSKLALFMDMTPELSHVLQTYAPEPIKIMERIVDRYMPTFYLAFEERSVHYGENFTELPDSVHGIYLCKAFLWNRGDQLEKYIDIPWVRADLFYIMKLCVAREFGEQ